MNATVQIAPDGMVIANLDSDDYAADDMLDQCARVAIAAWLEVRAELAKAGES